MISNEIGQKAALLILPVFAILPLSVLAAPESGRVDSYDITPPPPLQETPKPTVVKTAPAEIKSQQLHRLDFRMQGKSCPSCLLGIQNKLKTLFGVQDAAVMLKPPFGVSVVYKSDKDNSSYILTMIKAKEPVIKIFDVSDRIIDSMPLPLIPPFTPAAPPATIDIK